MGLGTGAWALIPTLPEHKEEDTPAAGPGLVSLSLCGGEGVTGVMGEKRRAEPWGMVGPGQSQPGRQAAYFLSVPRPRANDYSQVPFPTLAPPPWTWPWCLPGKPEGPAPFPGWRCPQLLPGVGGEAGKEEMVRDLSYLLWLNWTGPCVISGPLGDVECKSGGCVPTQEVFLEEGILG